MEWEWELRFEHEYGYLRPEAVKAYEQYLRCGILRYGCARLACTAPGCPGAGVLAYSCKRRLICPSCAAKRAVLFAEHLHENVLGEVPIRHMIFSVPKRLRPYFKYNRRNNNILFKASWDTVRKLYAEVLPLGRPGMVSVLQTAGERLNWNPHLHSLLSDGVFGDDGQFYELGYINQERFTDFFARRVLQLMQKTELITEEVAEDILSWKHSGFSVWAGEQISPTDAAARCFLGRYIDRGPLSLEKLSITDDIITYTANDESREEFDGTEFLATLQMHLPSRYESVLRRYGEYSYRSLGEQRKQAQAAKPPEIVPLSEQLDKKKVSRTWAALIQKVFEVDPTACPLCGAEMKIIAFPHSEAEIEKLCNSLGIPLGRDPPALRVRPPLEDYLLSPEDESQEYWH